MTRLKRLIVEVHQRSLWQALVVYLGASYAVLEAAAYFRDEFGLPDWLPPVALVLLLIGLPLVVVTSLVAEEKYHEEVPAEAAELAAEEDTRLRVKTWRTAGQAFVGALALWGVILTGWLLLGGSVPEIGAAGIPISPNRVAVMPFEYRGDDESAYLGAGIAEMLGKAIDGAGELSAVDPYTLLKYVEREHDDLDPQQGEEIAKRFGAGLYIYGNILEAGGSYRASATLYDVRRGRRADAEAMVDDEGEVLYQLIPDLARQLLVEQHADAAERLTAVGAATTESLDALKAYLQGERWARVGKYDSAATAYERAITEDTTFALAYYRLAANVWPAISARRRQIPNAVRFSSRLSTRDSLLVAALDAFEIRHDFVEAERLYRRIVNSYPDHVEAWRHLSMLLSDWLICRGHTYAEVWEAIARAVDLDPDNVDMRFFRTQHALYDGDTATARADLEHIIRLQPDGDFTPAYKALATSLRGDTLGFENVVDQLRRVPLWVVRHTARSVAVQAGDLSAAKRLMEILTEPSRSPRERAAGHEGLAGLEWAGGRLQACRAERAMLRALNPTRFTGSWWYNPLPPFPKPELAAIRDTLFAAWQPTGFGVYNRVFALGQLDAMTGQLDRALTMAAELEARAEELEDDGNHWHATIRGGHALTVRAQVAASQDRPETALRFLEQIEPAGRCSGWPEQIGRWLQAELLLNLGRYEEALLWYEPFAASCEFNIEFCAPARFRMGEIYERLGEPEMAARHYMRFLKLWHDCDPELQPYVDQAQRAVEQITAEPRVN